MKPKDKNTYFKGLNRKEYINRAIALSNKIGIDNITIRSLAEELKCSSAALYRYFKSKEELVYYVNLQVLENYIIRLNKAEQNWKTPWDMYSGVWDCYCREAFTHVKAYDQIFFQNTNSDLNKSMKEYYKLFPNNITHSNEIFQQMLSTSDFMGRDYKMCLKCADLGCISYDKAKQLNRSVCMLYKGYFKTIEDEGIEQYGVDSWTRQCIEDIDMIIFALADDLQGYKGYYVTNSPSVL